MLKDIIGNKYVRFLGIFLLILLVMFIISKVLKGNKKYMASVAKYQVAEGYAVNADDEQSDYYLFESYSEYIKFLGEYGVSGDLEEKDFQNKNYISYFMYVSDCSEKVDGVRKISVDDGNMKIYMDTTIYSCAECDTTTYLYFFPVDKKANVKTVTFKYNLLSEKECSEKFTYDKPILYLYPTYDTYVSVKLEHPEILLSTYPKYNDGWNMNIKTNGDMYDSNGKYYYALYWDEKNVTDVDFKEGFYVTKDNAIDFLEEKLSIIGLNDKERNEFIMYWLPKLENNGKSLVYFELTSEREKGNRLIINPKPDSMLRVIMHIKKVDRKINIPEEKLETFERNGFVAVEWGGVIH